jgi:hypothetical protein
VGYGANQLNRLGPGDSTYGALNALGAGMLATAAVISAVWGFVVLEATWAIVSLAALLRLMRRRGRNGALGGSEALPVGEPDRRPPAGRNESPGASGARR